MKIPGDAIHVWWTRLLQPRTVVRALAEHLNEQESRRAGRFYRCRDRNRYIVAHGVLRQLIGRYLDLRPQDVSFFSTNDGKPFVSGHHHGTLQFNMSHSDDVAVYAFAYGRRIGIDIEQQRVVPDAELVAEAFFSRSERMTLRSLQSRDRDEAFLSCWTRKEAYLKAVGTGIAAPLDEFDVTLRPGEPARLVRVRNNAEEASRWHLQELSCIPNNIGALAVDGHTLLVDCREWRVECAGDAVTTMRANA